MKKIFITSLAILLSACAFAQFSTEMALGTDMKYPVFTMNVGYQFDRIEINAEMLPAITRAATSNTYLGAKAGYYFGDETGILPSVGYYFDFISADNPELNKWCPGADVKFIHYLPNCNAWYADAGYINKEVIVSLGMHVTF